jgi:hopanoid biosynthesis associated protein HpnK
MVAADASGDAVARAKSLPELKVGLHLVLVRGRPALPPGRIPDLVGADGQFSTRLAQAGFRFFFDRSVRRQLAAEIRAQFERFHATGLVLDHVNAHNHMHLHPTVLDLVVRIGADFGLRAVRMPHEPFGPSWRAAREGWARRLANDVLLQPFVHAHRRKLRRAGIATNDHVFGMNDNGAMDRDRFLAFISQLPDGVSEIFCHPATEVWPEMEPEARNYRVADEFAALTDSKVAELIETMRIERISFGALARAA